MTPEREMEAAAALSAACEHEANAQGCCVFCGALRPDDVEQPWEPPVRRPRLLEQPAAPTPRQGLLRWLYQVRGAAEGSPYSMQGDKVITLSAPGVVSLVDAVLREWLGHRAAWGGCFEIAGRKHWFMMQEDNMGTRTWVEWEDGYTVAYTSGDTRDAALRAAGWALCDVASDYEQKVRARFQP